MGGELRDLSVNEGDAGVQTLKSVNYFTEHMLMFVNKGCFGTEGLKEGVWVCWVIPWLDCSVMIWG